MRPAGAWLHPFGKEITRGRMKLLVGRSLGPVLFAALFGLALLAAGPVAGVGQPGVYRKGRPAVVRVGRVVDKSRNWIQTDCALVGGDSGGPLFNLDGELVGIHSRINRPITVNVHVPINTYRDTWDRLVAG